MSWKTIEQPAATTAEQPKHQALQELDGVKALIERPVIWALCVIILVIK